MENNMYIVDKIIDQVLICENMETGHMDKFRAIQGVHEGDVIKVVDHKVMIDHEKTVIRKNRILDKVNRLEDKVEH